MIGAYISSCPIFHFAIQNDSSLRYAVHFPIAPSSPPGIRRMPRRVTMKCIKNQYPILFLVPSLFPELKHPSVRRLIDLSMYTYFVSLLTAIPLGVLVGAASTMPESRLREVVRADKTYTLQDWYQGWDFFSYVSIWCVPHCSWFEPRLDNGRSIPDRTLRTAT